MDDSKRFWESKTFWANIVAIVAMVGQSVSGTFVLPAEWQAAVLGVVNILLRLVTKREIVW